jgi:hypothetical protein
MDGLLDDSVREKRLAQERFHQACKSLEGVTLTSGQEFMFNEHLRRIRETKDETMLKIETDLKNAFTSAENLRSGVEGRQISKER